MLSLVEPLRAQGLDIRYDQVVLNVGDSLVQKIAGEISDGDFLIAIVSPDSVESEWCRRELSLAATQGTNERRVKVLPVRFRSAAMPPVLQDTFWADADRDGAETIGRQLAAAMSAHLEGRESEADRAAEEVEAVEGEPAHAELVGDAGVAQVEDVAQRCWDVFRGWLGIWRAGGNIHDLDDPQRRLRWALASVPDRVRGALPLVERLATSRGDEFFADADDVDDLEREIREELLAVRTRVAQGLPVKRRWLVTTDHGQVSAGRRHAVAYLWGIQRGDETRLVTVYISGTAMAFDQGPPPEVVAAKNTRGRSVLSSLVGLDDPPSEVMATTAGISLTLPD